MANNIVEFFVNIAGNARKKMDELSHSADSLSVKVGGIGDMFQKLSMGAFGLNNIVTSVRGVVSAANEYLDANRAQQEGEAKLAQVMRNTMGATAGEIQSIKELASAQQMLGVVGDEVQLAGAQELGTYLEKTESLKRLMPVMNDMLAQQYGLNASQEQAVTIGSMMGKVMEGQVGALSRYGYKFDEAQGKILKYGTEEERVATLAEVISQSVGGMNAALAATPEGKMQQLANNMGDVKERVGGLMTQVAGALMPAMEGAVKLMNGLVNVAQRGWPVWIGVSAAVLVGVTKVKQQLMKTSVAALVAGGGMTTMGALGKVACATISKAIMSIPIVGWVAAGVTLVAGVFKLLWDRSEKFRGAVVGLWEVIKGVAVGVWGVVGPLFVRISNAFKSLYGAISGAIKRGIGWLKGMLSKAGSFVARMLQPVVQIMGKIFNPIIELWNRVTKGSVEKFRSGYERGAAAVRGRKGNGTGLMAQSVAAVGGDAGMPTAGGGGSAAAGKSAEATATGGTRSTSITINLGKMVESIIFNGGLDDNAQNLEERVKEILMRTLYAAEMAAV